MFLLSPGSQPLITFRQPRPSAVAVGPGENTLEDVQTRLASIFRVCRDNTVDCVGLLVDVLQRGMRVLLSIFKGEPGSTYGDL
jgi:hypothetical protein